ncbi:rho GTPase-activating protein 30 [Mugil cephalus]|uniref:rho GTPase-activating protein 30 n=1 Tax=Mugil cephalus TaxID=48193 RepID=UPI001FB743C4|nr:rho GTPase-activating protein 30 [Mugil cephalus]XP_047446542.1 rho GTPase-activating protein 30 [Mugil cephalus]XP_047446543.1 rho GTPase-activating protein 30 [Mugil cephalus]
MRRVRRKGANKEKVFGCDLLEHLTTTSQEIPPVLRYCSEFVEQNGIVDGIYRLSGVSSNIQKLRGEFESEGPPDLNKDVYLQDIHCVSSLCKAYFRELPNPLLTYQLYDKFAEAVAIQLEEERLVKIADVLKELPEPHHRTLEYLMRHLVRMASYSSETNMHARNLAIVWAPNLLRSKDIEASGFNGTAAFMEVRVQSIVVEFILTHVPQLFPDAGVPNERRKSLPSPTAMCAPDEGFFKSPQAIANFGNISPGDGPLPIRPYHAIIEGIDKRKGSLKGRKWMSIFNIGGRFQETKRRHKHSTKEKEKVSLRPARSMDSLSQPYPNEVGRRHGQRPPSTNMSAVVTSSPQPSSDAAPPSGGLGSSEYAVTYRRGTGLVSGGAGTQGTYTALDPDNLGVAGNETVQSRSPGLTTKVGRRAAMHITGPTLVTVPLHITSNLAFGVLQGGGADRVIHRGRDKDGGDKVESKEGGEKPARRETRGMEWKVEEDKKPDEEEEKGHREKSREGVAMVEVNTEAAGGVGEEEGGGAGEEGDDEERGGCGRKQEEVTGGENVSTEQREKSANAEKESEEHGADDNRDVDRGYMHMKGLEPDDPQPAETEHTDALTSAEAVVEDEEDQELSGYVQDNFEFLDQMDCSAMDHMDCSVSYQMDEFSVEPPCHSYEEYELMEQPQSSQLPMDFQTQSLPCSETRTKSQSELKPHRRLSDDSQNRHTKSLSLPYMTSPVRGPEDLSSEEEDTGDECGEHDYSSDEDESMFIQSLPADFFLSGLEMNTDTRDSSTPKRAAATISSGERGGRAQSLEMTACEETGDGDRVEAEDKEDRLEENEKTGNEEELQQLENEMESKATEEPMNDAQSENALASDVSALCCEELPPPGIEGNEEPNTAQEIELNEEEEEELDGILQSDCPPPHEDIPCATKEEASPLEDCSAASTEHPGSCADEGTIETDGVEEEDSKAPQEQEDLNEIEEEEDRDIWDEFEEIICEMIEDEEQSEREGAAGRAGEMKHGEKDGEISAEKKVDTETEARLEGEEEEEFRHPEMKHEFEEDEVCSPKRGDLEKATQQKNAFGDEAQHRDRGEVKQPEKENNRKESAGEPYRTPGSADKQPQKESREREKGDTGPGSVERKLVVSKHPKVYQVKAVPVVPPKPQHCKMTALTLRQQQQERDRRDAADMGRDNATRAPAEQDRAGVGEQARDGDDEDHARKDKPTFRGGELDGERRNSPLSMCFDEAVAIATLRREKERIRDGEGEADGLGK